jgi:hypothetical protein
MIIVVILLIGLILFTGCINQRHPRLVAMDNMSLYKNQTGSATVKNDTTKTANISANTSTIFNNITMVVTGSPITLNVSIANRTIKINDTSAGNEYIETELFDGDSYYAIFNTSKENFGIPVCTHPASWISGEGRSTANYSWCNYDYEGYTYRTDTHRLKVSFIGEEWVISEMDNKCGGHLKFGKEMISGVINVGEHIELENTMFKFEDWWYEGERTYAILSVTDQQNKYLEQKIFEDETKELLITNKKFLIHIWLVRGGYTHEAAWIHLSIFSDEIQLNHGEAINLNNQTWNVSLEWTNKNNATEADHLKRIVLSRNT